jgi:hypothetical protein
VIEESRRVGRMPGTFNTTFIANIPKKDDPSTFDDYHPISLCNYIYKIITNTIALRLKSILLATISSKQFGLLEESSIMDVVGLAQEALHSIKLQKLLALVVKIDIYKAYYRVSWLHLRLIMLYVGFRVEFIQRVEDCFSSVTFRVFINGSVSSLFKPSGS